MSRQQEFQMARTDQLRRLAFQPVQQDHVDELKASIQKEGIREPVIVQYNPQNRQAYLGEGNHRFAAAEQLGMTEIPTRVIRTANDGMYGAADVEEAQDFPRNHNGYVPPELSPHLIGLDQDPGYPTSRPRDRKTQALMRRIHLGGLVSQVRSQRAARKAKEAPSAPQRPTVDPRTSDPMINDLMRLLGPRW